MCKKLLLLSTLFVLNFSVSALKATTETTNNYISDYNNSEISFSTYSLDLYDKINDTDLDFDAFKYGLKGYLKLQNEGGLKNTKYLTIIDMSVSANSERLYIINMETQQLEHKSLVAHGRNSGGTYAKQFSNKVNSYQTSLGFYKTAETYIGKHGFSLRLDGLEFSNNNARRRAVVIHEADYANPNYIKKNGRLGRSYGCPSLPKKDYTAIINKIKNGSCLFIYHPKSSYLKNSKLANSTTTLITTNS